MLETCMVEEQEQWELAKAAHTQCRFIPPCGEFNLRQPFLQYMLSPYPYKAEKALTDMVISLQSLVCFYSAL